MVLWSPMASASLPSTYSYLHSRISVRTRRFSYFCYATHRTSSKHICSSTVYTTLFAMSWYVNCPSTKFFMQRLSFRIFKISMCYILVLKDSHLLLAAVFLLWLISSYSHCRRLPTHCSLNYQYLAIWKWFQCLYIMNLMDHLFLLLFIVFRMPLKNLLYCISARSQCFMLPTTTPYVIVFLIRIFLFN